MKEEPKKIRLTFVEDAIRDAEEAMEHMAPHISALQKEVETNIIPHIAAAQKQAREAHDFLKKPSYSGDMRFLIASPPPRAATAQEIENIVVKHFKSRTPQAPITNSYDIFYNSKDKTLSRQVGQKTLTYKFSTGKRFPLFDFLVFTDEYTTTEKLRDELSCPSNGAVSKLVEGMNTHAKRTLGIKDNLIEGRPGFGYRIDKRFSIHKA